MTRGQAWEASLALAMLPVGAVLTTLSALACLTLAGCALALPFAGGIAWPTEAWIVAAAMVAGRTTLVSLEGLSALAWRPALGVMAMWAIMVALWPGWWLTVA